MDVQSEPALFEETGGGKVGFNYLLSWRGTYPFVKLQLLENKLLINCFLGWKVKIDIKNLESFSYYSSLSLFGSTSDSEAKPVAIQFKHKQPWTPPFVVYYGRKVKELAELLKRKEVKEVSLKSARIPNENKYILVIGIFMVGLMILAVLLNYLFG